MCEGFNGTLIFPGFNSFFRKETIEIFFIQFKDFLQVRLLGGFVEDGFQVISENFLKIYILRKIDISGMIEAGKNEIQKLNRLKQTIF